MSAWERRVNVFIVPLDGILTGIANDAMHTVDPNKNVSLTSNLGFSTASVISVLGADRRRRVRLVIAG
ncbi:MAG: hypothetical protein WCA12_06895 [Burkholderiales bacterium]